MWLKSIRSTTYLHNAKVHCTTRSTPFSLVVSRQPLITTIFVTTKAFPTDAKSKTPSEAVCYRHSTRVLEMQSNANKQMKTAKPRYKRYHDAEMREKGPLRADQLDYGDSPPCRRLLQTKWWWKPIRNYFHVTLDPIVSFRRQLTPYSSIEMEYRIRYCQTKS